MSFDSFLNEASRINIREPCSRVSSAVAGVPLMSKGPKLIGELAKEAALLPLRNISNISWWTLRTMGSLLGSTLKLGLKSAMLIPLPIPGGFENLAQVRADTRSRLQALDYAVATGDTRPLATIANEMNNGGREQIHG